MNKKRDWFGFLGKTNIRKQLYTIYILAVFVPVTLIGIFLLTNTGKLLTEYHTDLIASDNLRVRTILFEITSQVYNISEELSFNEDVAKILKKNYVSYNHMTDSVNEVASVVDNYMYNYSEIEQIEIYCDNPKIFNYKQYYPVTKQVESAQWYQKAISQSSVFWEEMVSYDKYNNEYWNLCLIRKIPLVNSDYNAVLVIRVSDNYLKTRMDSGEYQICATVDDGVIFYATDRECYGKEQVINIDYENDYFQYNGSRDIDGTTCFIGVSTLGLYQTDSKIYICTLNDESYENIKNIITTCVIIILLAIIVPGILIHFFTIYFTKRVGTLRHVMHQASNEDYEFEEIVRGEDELSEAFSDLQIMVQNIKEKDARMYEAMINEKELINEQQKMEFKMLASQINPHFLYNTLETIRMKAYTAGNREVATAIKLLGKSMRYVLENNGTAYTTLKAELSHIDIYMTIQKLRFENKFDYQIVIEDGIDVDACLTLPLLLQPVVENAVLHGLEERENGGIVKISVSMVESENGINKDIKIAVSDNGCGMDEIALETLRKNIEKKNPQKKESIGLYNINQRMKLCYGENYGMIIESVLYEGTTISLLLPLEMHNNIV